MKERESCCVRPCVRVFNFWLRKIYKFFFFRVPRGISLSACQVPLYLVCAQNKKQFYSFFFLNYFKIKKFELAIFGHRFGIWCSFKIRKSKSSSFKKWMITHFCIWRGKLFQFRSSFRTNIFLFCFDDNVVQSDKNSNCFDLCCAVKSTCVRFISKFLIRKRFQPKRFLKNYKKK